MSDGVIIAVITSATSLLLALVNAIIAWVQRRAQKKSNMESRIENIEKDVKKLTEHSELQYMALLRLTVMDTDMPTSERLVAGREYLTRGGNGDVRKFFEKFERDVNNREERGA